MPDKIVKKKILLTRPRASSERWAALLAKYEFDSLVEPLLTIAPTHAARPMGQFQAVMLTSANAVYMMMEMREAIADLLALPCFCVGAATGAAARQLGFTIIQCGDSDAAALARAMIGQLSDKALPILHIAGDIIDGKAQDILSKAGFTMAIWAVYQASAAEDLTAATRARFAAGEIAAVPVFSPRSARILVSLIEKNRLVQACHQVTAIGLSQPVADVLQNLPWRRLRVAAKPDEDSVLACLQAEASMNETDVKAEAAPASAMPTPKRAGKKSFLWGVLGLLLIAGVGSGLWTQAPWRETPVETAAPIESSPEIADLQSRVRTLEQRMDAQIENAAPVAASPAPGKDIAAVTENVKALQAQVAQMQEQTRKILAAALAFWDLREAAREGNSFALPLASLQADAGSDPIIGKQIAALQSYAAEGTPTLPALRAQLAAQEPDATATNSDSTLPLIDRLKALLKNLVSIHPLHAPEFLALENALDKGDALAAQAAFDLLPPESKAHLAAWRKKLQARAAIDEALRNLSEHFITSPAQGNAP